MFRHVDWLALYPMDNIPVLGKLITTFPVRALEEAEYRQSSMESDDKFKKIQKKNCSLNQKFIRAEVRWTPKCDHYMKSICNL